MFSLDAFNNTCRNVFLRQILKFDLLLVEMSQIKLK